MIKIKHNGFQFHNYNHNNMTNLVGWFKKYCGTKAYMSGAKIKTIAIYEFSSMDGAAIRHGPITFNEKNVNSSENMSIKNLQS